MDWNYLMSKVYFCGGVTLVYIVYRLTFILCYIG